MLVVSLLFLYMLFVTVVSGDAILNGMRSSTVRGEGRMPLTACAFAGLTAACVYAQLWSLFAAVSTAAVTLWLALCVLLALRKRRALADAVRAAGRTRGAILFLFLFFLFAYAASHGYAHTDTGLYHAQAIRWVEEAGAVRGPGNPHNRLAYNSAAFPMTAFFGFSFALTLKLSAGCMMLVALWPLCLLFRDRNRASRRVFWLTAAAVLAVVLPFLIRNVILSVYLIYPYPGLDLFDVPWKIPAEVAVQDAMEIGIYGRTVADAVTVFPLGLWICSWWESLQLSDRLVLIADLVALAGWILLAVRGMAAGRRKKPLPEELSYLPLMAALYASLLLWFLAAPLMRYGFAFVRLPAWISAGMRFAAAAATTAGKESPPCGNALCCSHGAADLLQRRASGMGRVPGVPPVLPRDAGGL